MHNTNRSLLCLLLLAVPGVLSAQTVNPPTTEAPKPAAASATSSSGTEDKRLDETVKLNPFVVNADADVGYLAANSLAGTRLNTSLKDTAASVSVMTEELLSDLGAVDMSEALKYANNVEFELGDSQNNTAPNGNNLMEFYQTYRVRGIPATVSRNYFEWKLPSDTYNISRIEESRGPNAVLFGIGQAGGILNTATKQPMFGRDFARLGLIVGSFDSLRSTVDWNKVLIKDKLSVRLNLLHSDTNTFREYAFMKNMQGHLGVKYNLSPKTSIRAEYEQGRIKDNVSRTYNLTNSLQNWLNNNRPTVAAPVATNASMGLLRLAATPRVTYIQNNDSLLNWANTMSTSGNSAVITDEAYTNRAININGPGATRKSGFKAFSAFFDHQFGEKTYFQASFNHQDYTFDSVDATVTGTNLLGDPNRNLPGGGVNPYAGQLMLETAWFRRYREESSNTVMTMFSTGYNAKKWGDYRMVALAQYEDRHFKSSEYVEAWQGAPFNTAPENAANQVFRRNYVTEGVWDSYYINSPMQFGLINGRTDPVSGRTLSSYWVQRANTPEDDPSTQTSFMFGLQARYFDGRIVANLGYRRDEVKTDDRGVKRDATNTWAIDYGNVQQIKNHGDTKTLGLVAHVTKNISVVGNYATNIGLPNPRIAITPSNRPPPSKGEGKDIGLAFSLLHGRIYARAVYFETEGTGLQDFRLQAVNNTNNRVISSLLGAGLINQAAADGRTLAMSGSTFDRRSDGYELSVTANITKSWRLMANWSRTNATEDNIAPEVKAWAADAFPYWSSFPQSFVTSGGQTLAQEQINLQTTLDEQFETEGQGQFGNRRDKVGVFTRYEFGWPPLKGLYIGGGYNHQSKMLVGRDTATLEKIYGNSYWLADALLGYKVRGMPKRMTLNFQLNVANVFENTDPLIVRYQGATGIRRLVLVAPRTFRLSANLGF